MRKKLFNLVDKNTGKVVFSGSKKECEAKQKYKIVYTGGDINPIFIATTNNGKQYKGTMKEIAKKFNLSYLNAYNYTRCARQKDGLFIERAK